MSIEQAGIPWLSRLEPATSEDIFAAKMRSIRSDMGMSQVDLARRAGVQEMVILRMEKRRRRITLNEAVAIAKVLNISLAGING
jgi:transcriptional regulator with XRE-family HTH domain